MFNDPLDELIHTRVNAYSEFQQHFLKILTKKLDSFTQVTGLYFSCKTI